MNTILGVGFYNTNFCRRVTKVNSRVLKGGYEIISPYKLAVNEILRDTEARAESARALYSGYSPKEINEIIESIYEEGSKKIAKLHKYY